MSVDPDIMTTEEVAELLRCSHDLVNHLARTAGLPFIPVGPRSKRFRRAAVLEWIEARETRQTERPAGEPETPKRIGRPSKGDTGTGAIWDEFEAVGR